MKIEELQAEWDKDSPIDEARLNKEAARIPTLHNKWLRYLYTEKGIYEAMNIEYDELVAFKTLYFTGKIPPEELSAKGLEPFHHRLLKQDVDMYLAADKDINKLRMRRFLQKEKLFFIEDVIKHINGRNFILGTITSWVKFTSGST